MNDIAVIKLLLKKENYGEYHHVLSTINTEVEIKKLIVSIHRYYEDYPHHEFIAMDELVTFFYILYPSERNNPVYEKIFGELRGIEVSDSLAGTIVRNYIERDTAGKIIEILAPVLNGDSSNAILSVGECLQEYRERTGLVDEENSLFVEHDARLLESLLDDEHGLPWSLGCLNDNIGRLPGGTLGHIFARVEAGKTAFCTDTIGAWIENTPDDVAIYWFTNEEAAKFILQRAMQRLLGATREELAAVYARKGPDYINQRFHEKGGHKLHMIHDQGLSIEKIYAILDRAENPRAAIVDIADHVSFRSSGEMSQVQKLGELYRRYRFMADHYDIDVLTAGQANVDAEDKMYVNMDDMHNSKTDKPAALDYAIGIGRLYKDEKRRYINVPKCKLKTVVRRVNTVNFDVPHIKFKDL
jgi:hypothetical protein